MELNVFVAYSKLAYFKKPTTFACKLFRMKEAYLLLGSNLGDRFSNITESIIKIGERAGLVTRSSSVYETEPWGTDDKLPFLNTVICINTTLEPASLLSTLLDIESDLGRIRGVHRNEPRTIDIDILLYADEVINKDNLIIPHERMHLRRFVLIPMVELEPELRHPLFGKTMKTLLDQCSDSGWVRKYNHN